MNQELTLSSRLKSLGVTPDARYLRNETPVHVMFPKTLLLIR